MKRAITALALVGALLLSVVACQVYNPTDNSTLYTAMRSEGATSWADYSKEFEEADADGKYKLLAEYETFRKLHKDQAAWEGAVKEYEDAAAAYEADSTDANEIKTAVNRWCSLQGVTRKPRRTKEEMQTPLTPFETIKSMIKKANTKECTKYKELLDSLIIICNERINEVKQEEIKELEEEIQMLQSLLDEMKK